MATRVRPDSLLQRRIILIAAVNLTALGSLTAPTVVGLPRAVAAVVPAEERAAALAAVLAAGALAALVLNPVFGALSDRTRGPLGRRRPWILAGAAGGVLAICGLNTATAVPTIMLWWVLAQACYNAMMAPAAALLADLVPENRRAKASGLFTAGAFVGALPPLLLASALPGQIQGISLIMPVLGVVVAILALRLPDGAPTAPGAASIRTSSVRANASFWAVWVQRLVMQTAFGLTSSFTLYLVVDRMTDDAVSATSVTTVATFVGGAGIVVGATWAGALASRRGRYLPFLVVGAIGLALAGLLRAAAVAPLMVWIAGAIGGASIGCYLAVNLALAMRTVPRERAGTFLGVLNIAETLPGVYTPVLAAMLFQLGAGDPLSSSGDNYAALYICAAVVAMLSLLTVPALRRVARRPDSGTRLPTTTAP